MDAGVQCNKEMVDLLMRVKKHLKAHHQIVLNMSDPNLLTRLLQLATIEDDVLQGMVRYLMALAGGEWNQRYLVATGTMAKTGDERSGRLSARTFTEKLKERMLADTAADLSGVGPGAPAGDSQKVRYYRGQPVYG